VNEEIVLRKLDTRNKVRELKNFHTLAHKIKRNWENQLEKTQLTLEEE
jgi:hypothetical protein